MFYGLFLHLKMWCRLGFSKRHHILKGEMRKIKTHMDFFSFPFDKVVPFGFFETAPDSERQNERNTKRL